MVTDAVLLYICSVIVGHGYSYQTGYEALQITTYQHHLFVKPKGFLITSCLALVEPREQEVLMVDHQEEQLV